MNTSWNLNGFAMEMPRNTKNYTGSSPPPTAENFHKVNAKWEANKVSRRQDSKRRVSGRLVPDGGSAADGLPRKGLQKMGFQKTGPPEDGLPKDERGFREDRFLDDTHGLC